MAEAKLLLLFLLFTNLLAQKHFADSLDQCSATAEFLKICKVHASVRLRVRNLPALIARAWPNTGLDMSDTGSNRKNKILILKYPTNNEILRSRFNLSSLLFLNIQRPNVKKKEISIIDVLKI